MSIFDFPSRLAWQVSALVAGLAFALLAHLGIAIALAPILALAGLMCGLFALAWVYTYWRPDPKLAACAMGAAYLLGMSGSAGPLTYPMAALSGPLQDHAFIAFERGLGLDWPGIAASLSATPTLRSLWQVAYESSLLQLVASVMLLVFTGRRERLAIYLQMVFLTLLAVNALSCLLPAIGPIRSYGIADDLASLLGDGGVRHLTDFFALRDGSFALFDMPKTEGIVTFPSFHCVLAVLTAWALWPLRWIGLPLALLNALVLVSTIPQGGHYLADILAGTGLALAALALHLAPALSRPAPALAA